MYLCCSTRHTIFDLNVFFFFYIKKQINTYLVVRSSNSSPNSSVAVPDRATFISLAPLEQFATTGSYVSVFVVNRLDHSVYNIPESSVERSCNTVFLRHCNVFDRSDVVECRCGNTCSKVSLLTVYACRSATAWNCSRSSAVETRIERLRSETQRRLWFVGFRRFSERIDIQLHRYDDDDGSSRDVFSVLFCQQNRLQSMVEQSVVGSRSTDRNDKQQYDTVFANDINRQSQLISRVWTSHRYGCCGELSRRLHDWCNAFRYVERFELFL